MKAVLKFDLDEEREEFNNAIKGGLYLRVLQEFDEQLRKKIKYDGSITEEQYEIYDKIREELHLIAENHEASF